MTDLPDLSFLPDDFTPDHLEPAQQGMAKVGALLMAVVDDALRPALKGRRIQTCLHAVDEANGYPHGGGLLPIGAARSVSLQPLLCPMHPGRLLCTRPGCLDRHYETEHQDEHRTAGCFVCAAPLTADFIEIFAAIELRRPVLLYHGAGRDFSFTGTLMTTPVTYLCARDAGLVQVPIRMEWPSDAER